MVGFVSLVLILLPAALALLYVRSFGVSVVFSDAWSMARTFGEWSSGTLTLSDFFDQHNEHRMFFPKAVEFLLGRITGYDNVAEMYLIQVCFLVTLAVLFLAFRVGTRSSWLLLLFVPISFLVFSFRQYENMLWGFQISFAFTQTFGVLALFLLYVSGRGRFGKGAFVAALGSATVASFSNAQGLFLWPVGLLLLAVSPLEKSAKRVWILIWTLVGLAEWIAYFADFARRGNSSSLSYALYHPIVGAQYFSNLLGSSLFWRQNSAFIAGLLLVCLALVSLFVVYRDKKLSEYSFWLSLLLYSFLILGSITLGRAGEFGPLQAMAPRYTSFSILAVVAIYAVLVKVAFDRRSTTNTLLLAALSGAILLSAAVSYQEGIKVGSKERATREKAAFVLSTYETQPDEALTETLHPRARVIRERAPVLQSLGYNVFSGPQDWDLPPLSDLYPISSPASSATSITGDGLRQENESIIVPAKASFIKLTGWAVDAGNESAAGGVYVDIDGELFPAFYGVERQDIADSFGMPSYRYSGFERFVPVPGVGAHELSIVILTADREGYYPPTRKVALQVE
ncbi:MAG: hypothetical protein AVDCRST_MAG28-955 [uncultured Rubrobacteraceae bacterium]|uniref:Glycosyltransferase RgtA/B/C/D-like domain-containing protein n=1 Tax=uncultured Rubrobacteraceae bacterium TaxID=349277 RepID=A0A6J4QUH3_9ACTN|nr:MAG: hypothetical protein AVDCRST_MAG28-955 [uncultured Rubrobacteraceae bacterium]